MEDEQDVASFRSIFITCQLLWVIEVECMQILGCCRPVELEKLIHVEFDAGTETINKEDILRNTAML